jgi:hypothetical protein
MVPILEKEMGMNWMKNKTLRVAMAALTVGALSTSAVPDASAAITHQGKISSNNTQGIVLLQADIAISPNPVPVLKFKFVTRAPGEYKMRFCVGATAEPCGPNAYVVTLGPQDERIAVIAAQRFRGSVLFVSVEGVASVDPIPFEVTME